MVASFANATARSSLDPLRVHAVASARVRALPLIFLLLSAGCSGTIVVGYDLDGSPSSIPDTGTPRDTGPGSPDTGMPLDAGPGRDAGDGGAGCAPGFPASWPYPITGAAYKSKFWSGLAPIQAQCTLPAACHGMGSRNPPSIPATALEVDANPTLLIQQLWVESLGGLPNATLSTHHKQGAVSSHPYTPEEQSYVDNFLRAAAGCNGCTGGTCTCPAPAACTAP